MMISFFNIKFWDNTWFLIEVLRFQLYKKWNLREDSGGGSKYYKKFGLRLDWVWSMETGEGGVAYIHQVLENL